MDLRAGDIEVTGSDNPVVRVSCRFDHGDAAANKVKISFAADHLTIRGGSNDGGHFVIEIPRSTGLLVHCSAGNLTVSGVVGDKDINLNAGNLTIKVGDAADYRYVDASVMAGDLVAPAFGASKDGMFRNFKKDNPAGKYRLRAALLAGDLTLK